LAIQNSKKSKLNKQGKSKENQSVKSKKVENEIIQSEITTGVSSQDIQMMIDNINKKQNLKKIAPKK
jgi:hypothetical protein